jgi:predicted glycosyltransferase involved in capsule biosynthesis
VWPKGTKGVGLFSLVKCAVVVVPLRVFSPRDRDLFRLRRLLKTVPEGIDVVVADDSPCHDMRNLVAAHVLARRSGRYVNCFANDGAVFSIGKLRDAGVRAASTDYVLLHDVDFIAPEGIYAVIASHEFQTEALGDSIQSFCCIPVFFTSPVGWQLRLILRCGMRFGLIQSYLRSLFGLWLGRLVLGSSALLIRRSYYLELGGHSNEFIGHGAEDFEFLHRLSMLYPMGSRPLDYTIDCGTLGFEEKGFREYFSRYGRYSLEHNIVLFHLIHFQNLLLDNSLVGH